MLDYKNGSLFDHLLQLCQEMDYDVLIGSSIGGRMAYYLSNVLEVPALMFNPALVGGISDDLQAIPPYDFRPNARQFFVFGKDDEVVDPNSTLNYLGEGIEHRFYDMGHRISPECFEAAILEFQNFLST